MPPNPDDWNGIIPNDSKGLFQDQASVVLPLNCSDNYGVVYTTADVSNSQGTAGGNGDASSSDEYESNGASSLSSGAIAGIVVGAVILAAAVGVCCFVWKRRWHRPQFSVSKSSGTETSSSENYDNTIAVTFPDEANAFTTYPSSSGKKSSSLLRNLPIMKTISDAARHGAADPWAIPAKAVEIDLDEQGRYVVLGRGGFGVVYRGMLNGVQPVAVKVVRHPGKECRAVFLREVAILERVSRDRNVVQLYGTCFIEEDLMIVTELMKGGDLREALSGPRGRELAWGARGRQVALDVTRGICFLHANNVIHRDLKSKNVLLSDDWSCAKIADVGAAAIHLDGYLTPGAGQVMGTLAWAAPELLLGQRCTPKVDIFSLGVMLWEIATGGVPQRGFVEAPPIGDACPQEVADLVTACLDPDPANRPTAREVYDGLLASP